MAITSSPCPAGFATELSVTGESEDELRLVVMELFLKDRRFDFRLIWFSCAGYSSQCGVFANVQCDLLTRFRPQKPAASALLRP